MHPPPPPPPQLSSCVFSVIGLTGRIRRPSKGYADAFKCKSLADSVLISIVARKVREAKILGSHTQSPKWIRSGRRSIRAAPRLLPPPFPGFVAASTPNVCAVFVSTATAMSITYTAEQSDKTPTPSPAPYFLYGEFLFRSLGDPFGVCLFLGFFIPSLHPRVPRRSSSCCCRYFCILFLFLFFVFCFCFCFLLLHS